MVTTTGVQAQGEGRHYDTMTRMTAMVTTMQDRLQERFPTMRPTTSLDYVIRQTDRLQELRLKLFRFFPQFSRDFAQLWNQNCCIFNGELGPKLLCFPGLWSSWCQNYYILQGLGASQCRDYCVFQGFQILMVPKLLYFARMWSSYKTTAHMRAFFLL